MSRYRGRLARSRAIAAAAELGAERPPLRTAITAGTIRLAYGKGGGFSVSRVGGLELLVETAVGMDRNVASELIAADAPAQADRVQCTSSSGDPRAMR